MHRLLHRGGPIHNRWPSFQVTYIWPRPHQSFFVSLTEGDEDDHMASQNNRRPLNCPYHLRLDNQRIGHMFHLFLSHIWEYALFHEQNWQFFSIFRKGLTEYCYAQKNTVGPLKYVTTNFPCNYNNIASRKFLVRWYIFIKSLFQRECFFLSGQSLRYPVWGH